MHSPTVSFVIPCYNLAHLLPDCINSILSQTYRDFEVLIMDDCSPDNTVAVVNSFHDHRLRYVRNQTNLRHLRNYNKGIELSCGRYVWLISADDYLRRPYILQKYVALMENNYRIGFTFCPGVGVRGGEETEVLGSVGDRDMIFDGHALLKQLLFDNLVLAPSAMVRRECYENISLFPLDVTWAGKPVDMGWVGDWYLWCVFALKYDVGYFSESMVCYREHNLSMTNSLTRQENVDSCATAEIAVPWLIRNKAIELGLPNIAMDCRSAIAHQYAQHCTSRQYRWLDRASNSSLTLEQLEESLCQSTEDEKERVCIRARCFAEIGDRVLSRGDVPAARKFYLAALQQDPRMTKLYVKLLLLVLGRQGDSLRRLIRSFRSIATG